MNITEPYKLYFNPNRQERYYGQLLSWSNERPNPYGNLKPRDVYAADGGDKNTPYEISELKKYAEPFAFGGKTGWMIANANGIDDAFENIAGKGKLCRAAGLTGAEKKACKQSIKNKCGRRPKGFLGIKGARKRELQAAWTKCAQEMVVTPEEAAKSAAEDIVPQSEREGLSTGAQVMIGVAVFGTLALVGLAVASRMKKRPAPMRAPMARG